MSTLSWRTRAASLGLGLLGGLVAAFSLPPFGLWPLAIAGIALFLLACEDRPVGTRGLTGFAFGLGMFVPGLWWAQHFNWYGAVFLMILESLYFLGAGLVMTPGRGRTLTAVGALVLAEALRSSWPLGGLPIGGLPLGQANGPFLDIARVGGPLGIVFVLVVSAAGVRIALTALAIRNTPGLESARRIGHLILLGTLVFGAILIGLLSPNGGTPIATRSVAAVQGGGARGTSAQQVDPVSVTKAQLAALKKVPVGTQLTVLPEDVVGLNGPLAGSWQAAALSTAANEKSTTLLAGVTTPSGERAFDNFVAAWGPNGAPLGRVDKVHRVPFGEYVPARSLMAHIADLSGVPRDAIPGTKPEVLITPAGTLGVLISFEVFFADRSADAVNHGATVLIVPTNTTSYPSAQMPGQELAAAQLQAVERGRDLVQASPTGYSVIINHEGVVVRRSELSSATAVVGTLSLRSGQTLFTRVGAWPVLLSALSLLLIGQGRAILPLRRRSRRSKAPTEGDEPLTSGGDPSYS
jgi:apolipoprotein N-acyltransferase